MRAEAFAWVVLVSLAGCGSSDPGPIESAVATSAGETFTLVRIK